jgi:hypothetical protein
MRKGSLVVLYIVQALTSLEAGDNAIDNNDLLGVHGLYSYKRSSIV